MNDIGAPRVSHRRPRANQMQSQISACAWWALVDTVSELEVEITRRKLPAIDLGAA